MGWTAVDDTAELLAKVQKHLKPLYIKKRQQSSRQLAAALHLVMSILSDTNRDQPWDILELDAPCRNQANERLSMLQRAMQWSTEKLRKLRGGAGSQAATPAARAGAEARGGVSPLESGDMGRKWLDKVSRLLLELLHCLH